MNKTLCSESTWPRQQWSNQGPRRVSRDEITTSFADGWQVDSLEPATIAITTDPAGVRAWLLAATRT